MTEEHPPRDPDKPLRFRLVRTEDESGVSGTGVVAYGVLWTDGAVDLQWCNHRNDRVQTDRNGFASYHSERGLEDCLEVHGHEGRTTIEWIDTAPGLEDL
ncbi:hypothetical protein M197_gp26 [Haloarcula hispanica tailed virus 2]|uniref:Uncharacterized protein n=1 Tax=Haloarcula hispanica tailed virus 2 TaxID=1273751 RepID=R4TG36_9CAUD|nr:hypothetical protein M197_gp26 [Haloarcula hispanica tailed virus 2]AGM11191.1 hypothetical protein HHTV2_26 [Haloarcula hispanica tailed virus 2]